jgi:phage shock protein C
MTSSTRPLHRSTKNSMIAGVLGGLAEYFDLDPTMLRVVYVVVSILSVAFPGILVYLALWMIIPEDRSTA